MNIGVMITTNNLKFQKLIFLNHLVNKKENKIKSYSDMLYFKSIKLMEQ